MINEHLFLSSLVFFVSLASHFVASLMNVMSISTIESTRIEYSLKVSNDGLALYAESRNDIHMIVNDI